MSRPGGGHRPFSLRRQAIATPVDEDVSGFLDRDDEGHQRGAQRHCEENSETGLSSNKSLDWSNRNGAGVEFAKIAVEKTTKADEEDRREEPKHARPVSGCEPEVP